ncbi:MAG: gliding motility-associated C-terminal domain-containing protein [Chitinophagales bacterium]|nr:gliding motility-associated C-terminal domain-containing protein [Chitinophagales bacterium]MDW8418823.1 gliding motility-associated C-terminal domain-containing protein [Chitinophagales bacterium]
MKGMYTYCLRQALNGLLVLVVATAIKAQTYNDGAMNIQMMVGYSWVESVDDPIFGELNANEFRFRWWGDGNGLPIGWQGGTTIGANSGSAGWVTGQDVLLFNNTWGTPGSTPQPVPQYVALQGEGWEDDCFDCFRSTGTFTWACDQCSSFIYDGNCTCSTNILCGCSAEDQHCGPTVISNTINYRAIAPCLGLFSPSSPGSGFVGDFFSNVCGNDDIGAEVIVRWTPPIPAPIATTSNVLCQPGLVTLQTSGAVFGGDYRWYNHNTNVVVGTGSQITPFVGTTTTFRVHTFNGACESLSYRLITITVGQPTINSVTSVNPTCFGGTNGSITINASGGTPPIQYSINGGGSYQSSNVFNNLPAGFYNVIVKDANNCAVTYSGNSVVLTQPQAVSIFVSKLDAICHGSNTGRIEILAGGGSGSLQYSIDGGSTFLPSNIFPNLPAGNYNIVVKDGNNCTYNFAGNPVVISQPTPVSATTNVTNASCAGNANGSITVNATGGVSPYQYSLNNGPFFPSSTFTGLAAGSYTILVKDNNGCQFTTNATLTNSYTLTAQVQSQTDVSCAGGADGSVTLTQTGGVAPFEYSLNGGATWQTSPTFNGLSGGIYTGTVKDFNGCIATVTFTIIEKPPLVITVMTVTNVACYGGNTGAITTTTVGGDGNYTYLWSQGAQTPNLNGVPAGNYSVTVTDGAGCTASASATITSNPQLIVQVEKIHPVLCHGGNSGAIDITTLGGLPGYTYQWSTSATTEDVGGLYAGNYFVTVTDAANCTVSAQYQITQPGQQVGVNITATDVSCHGGADGALTASGTGGTPPYQYLWSNGLSGHTISGLPAGLYVVLVRDSNLCEYSAPATVNQPTPITINETILPAKCNTSADGGITLSVSGGTPGYTYNWSNLQSGSSLNGVATGNYTVTVQDSKQCSVVKSYFVPAPPPILSSVAGSDPDCHGNATGFAVVDAAGGTPVYTYVWSTTPPQTGLMAIKLSGGIPYTVTITDANGCSATNSITLNEPSPVVVTTIPGNIKCFGGNNGTITVQASGGSGIYEYYLNGVYQASPVFTGLTAGTYTVVAEDNNNCVGSANVTLTQPQAFSVNAGPDVVSVRGQTVSLNGSASSTNGIIGYFWNPPALVTCDTCAVTGAKPDSTHIFVLTALDGDSCLASDSVVVYVKYAVSYFIPTAFTPNADGLNDYFEFDILGAQSAETSVFNRWGERVYFNPAQPNGNTNGNAWDGTLDGKKLPPDTYVYMLKVKYYDDSVEELSGTITLMR